ncbi:hypothetical protein ACFE04_008474 [Oxalis oulophora]
MADSFPQPDKFGLRKISSSLFSVPSFVSGFSTKNSVDPDSVRSPTSPLDFKLFEKLSNPFSGKTHFSSSTNGFQKKWDCCKVGLCIVNSLVCDPKPNDQIIHSPRRNNFVLGRQTKTHNVYNSSRHDNEYPRISNSVPKNFTISPLSRTKLPSSKSSSSIQHLSVGSKKFCSEDRSTITSSPLTIDGGSHSLLMKSSSLPIPIVGSLSVREIELSEDYTCIISHGPNPKMTHIFGDCVLDGDVHELANVDDKKDQETESTRVAEHSTPFLSDQFSVYCTCKQSLEKSGDIYINRGCDCHSEEIFAEEEIDNSCNNSSKGSPASSYHEDLFQMGMPIA